MLEPHGEICRLTPPAIPRTVPIRIGATVKFGPPWTVDLDPIQLEDYGDVVVWDLNQLWVVIPGIAQVMLTFSSGRGVPTPLGPFTKLAVDLVTRTATGTGPDSIRDCYRYNIEVVHKSGQSWKLFPVDPQIDNLAPPPMFGEEEPPTVPPEPD